ncbi:MAG: hypothetical protein PVG66_08950 [Chromatiales bacterium]
MKLFIGNIPGDALLIDLYEFLGGLNLQAGLQHWQGGGCRQENYHYVIAQVAENSNIDALVYALDGMHFQGRFLAVREYGESNILPQCPYPAGRQALLH